MDFVASRHIGVDIGCIKANFQRKSELLQTKTAVLNDKERELRLLEQQLAARERAILWQEHQMDANTSSKHTSAQLPLESGNYWQHRKDPNGQQAEKYGGQLTKEDPHAQHRYTSAIFDHYQHVQPPDAGVPASTSGWAMEKLEEQFARLVYTRTTDALSHQPHVGRTQACVQQPSEIHQRPETVTFYPVNRHFNSVINQDSLMHKYANVVRKRGRPRNPRSRYAMRMPSEPTMTVGMPVRPQWMHNLYMQMLKNNAVTSSAAGEVMRHNLAQQMSVNSRHAGNALMMADSCQNAPEIFSSGQLLPNEQSAEESAVSQNQQQSVLPAATPSRVRQLLASAASTSGASILPPLSPIHSAEFSTSVASNSGYSHVPQDSFQHRRSSGDNNVSKDIAYRLVDNTAVATDHAANGHYRVARSEQATFVDRTVRCAASHQEHLSDEVFSARVTVTDSNASDCSSEVVHSNRDTTNHILPKVSSFDAGHCWYSPQSEQENAVSDHTTTVRDTETADDGDDGDDDDHRLVVVIESD